MTGGAEGAYSPARVWQQQQQEGYRGWRKSKYGDALWQPPALALPLAVRRSGRAAAARDAAAADAALHDFAGALVSAAEELRTPTAAALPLAPPPPLSELEAALGVQQAPTADEMQLWRHQWRQWHREHAGGGVEEEWQLLPAPHVLAADVPPLTVQQPRAALTPLLAVMAPGAGSTARASQLFHQHLQQSHQQEQPQQQQQQVLDTSSLIPLFVSSGTVSPRVPVSQPATAIAATAAAAASDLPTTAQIAQRVLTAQYTQLQQLGLPRLAPVASAAAEAARQAAEEAAQAAAAAALPPSLRCASLSGKVLHAGPPAADVSASEAGSSVGQHVLPPRQPGQQPPQPEKQHGKQPAQQHAAAHHASGDEHDVTIQRTASPGPKQLDEVAADRQRLVP
ncbi:hypothetical protein D9Q98_002949 [Chlorella vulgaris]|uniref:Uncharacterized protein n=1 Tax=Chlorella vulgaris TaxID=3077 RepID=A0A9D4TVN2_CHLVU|nr:hypothetical protein D9Q98_002949 [Chlorella vulgaris]